MVHSHATQICLSMFKLGQFMLEHIPICLRPGQGGMLAGFNVKIA
jgi:hypothetical protein